MKRAPAVLPAVVARVNGEDLTKDDVEGMIMMTSGQTWNQIPSYSRDETLHDALDGLIEQTAMAQDGKARGITVEESEITRMQQAPVMVLSVESTPNGPAAARRKDPPVKPNFSVSYIRRMLLAAKAWEAELAAGPSVSDADLKAYYAAHRQFFEDPTRTPARMLTFEEAVPSIKMILVGQKQAQHMGDFMEGLKKKAKVEVLF